ncbi:BTAD domain-containing putative transcriptional regulator [Streptomyces sp. NPDC050844]|uniref:BTAD domain-containing putative transcriptional regulator n=1 Tax=Streptomyces sp. NPDC050844 TaxID=3155790 RepID=UPI0033F8DBFE
MTSFNAVRTRMRAAATAVGTGVVTLALLAGMPYVLWRATGMPWPQQVVSWTDLTGRLAQPLGDPMLVELLAMAGWLCWAAFTSSVVREVFWYAAHLRQLLGDRSAHDVHLARLSVKGSLAALCVGTLVVALLGLWRPTTASAYQAVEGGDLRAHVAVMAPLDPVSLTSMGEAAGPQRAAAPGVGEGAGHVQYTVVEGDNLWDIAAAHLGDSLTWPRIYALNKERVQADGDRLTDPDLIKPGWRLSIPVQADAPAPRPSPPSREDPAEVQPPNPEQAQPSPQPTSKPSPAEKPKEAAPPTRPDWARGRTEPAAISIGAASVIGVTTAAGIASAVAFLRLHQRRRRHANSPAARGSQAPAPPSTSDLTASVRGAVFAARTPTQPAQPRTPVEGGEAAVHRITPKPAQGPGAVTIGVAGGVEVGLDVLAGPGGCAFTGQGAEAAARALIIGVLTAAERTRPEAPAVGLVAPRNLVAQLVGPVSDELDAVESTGDLAHAIARAEQHLIVQARHVAMADQPAPVPARTGGAESPGHLVLLARPDSAMSSQLAAVAARSEPGILTVIALGPLSAAHQLTIADDGRLTHPPTAATIPDDLELFRLDEIAADDVLEVIHGAHDLSAPSSSANEPAPFHGWAPKGAEPESAAPAVSAQQRVRLQVLGPVTIWANGRDEPVGVGLREEVREFLALLAAHPSGMRAEEIALHLRMSDDPKRALQELKNMRRAVRRALRSATGVDEEFIQLNSERHRLDTTLVETDLACFTQALACAAKAPDETQRMAHVRCGLDHYAGPFAAGSDYPWSEGIREGLHRKAADATVRLAEYTADSGDTDAALALLDEAITANPNDETLYQRTIRLQQAAGRDDAAQRTYDLLVHQLRTIGLLPTAASSALVEAQPSGGRRR